MTESAPWRGSLPGRPVRWSVWSNGSTLTKAGACSRRLKYPADVSSTSPASRCPATGSSMQVSVCVSPSSGPDSCRTATPIALWQYGRRHDCRDYQRQLRMLTGYSVAALRTRSNALFLMTPGVEETGRVLRARGLALDRLL